MNMEALSISWLVTSASAPLVAVLALWTIYVFHTYRRRWRTVDLFLLAVIAQELVSSVSVFSLSITNLLLGEACPFSQWVTVSSRTLQVATLASLSIDRALTVRWPYRYRFSVRRNQIRWHVAALALAAGLVGGAALFARTGGGVFQLPCRLDPQQWDVRYAVFLVVLQGALVVVSMACLARVEVHRWGAGGTLEDGGSPDLPAGGMSSPLDTQSSTGSTRALHRPSRQASRRPYGRKGSAADLRWPSVALTALLCFFCNHIPYLVLSGLATWHPWLWTRWHEAILCWLGLLEGLLVPLLLFCRDPALRTALRRAFQRRSGALSPLVGDDGPFQMYFDKDHFRKRGTFGSVTPIGIITNYRRTPGGSGGKKGGPKYALHGHDSVLSKSCFLGGGEPLSKLSCADLTSLEMWREEDEENFYATLSDDFSTFSCKSADDSALSEDLRLSEELYGGSFTTVANDDFEFHDTRPCGGEVRMKPCLVSPATPPGSRKTSFKDNIRLKVNLPMSPPNQSVPAIPKEEDEYKDPDLFILPPAEWKNDSDDPTTDLSSSPPSSELPTPPERTTSMSRHPKSTSYSMNDLDLIHKGIGPSPGAEVTFALPVKSESTMSLYRLNVDQDVDQVLAMTPSRSENNVNGDSGFGSGAQSTNPVWSGFLCRKPSDPFWNMRKPTAHAPSSSSTPTKNYPGILHPRMRKIPWITAWKKLDENSVHNERNQKEQSPPSPQVVEMGCQTNVLGWKDNLVYESNGVISPEVAMVGTIDEELSDLGSPVCNIINNNGGDYNLNIFAKESGVLIENAYGKLVRDDLGVQVNFYKKNLQCEDREDNNNHRDLSNLFERDVEPVRPACLPIREQTYFQQEDKIENKYPFQPESVCEKEEPFKCDQRLNGGHYENLFGTKENIFAGCDLYKDRRQEDNNRGSFRNEECSKNIYGQLNKVGKGGRSPQKSKLTRRESDNRGNRAPRNRRENRTRSDTRDMFPKEAATTFAELRPPPEKNLPVEIEMKNVVSKPSETSKLDRKDSGRKIPERKLSGRIPVHVHTRESAAKPLDVSFRCSNQPVERKSSERRAIPRPIERKNSGRPDLQKKTAKNEGLWANALPFDQDDANGNSPQRKGAAKTPFKRSPRRSQLPRRESSGNRNDRPVSNAKRKAEVPPPPDDFLKYREKCEDNFSHIQNLNREGRVDHGAKLNGNDFPHAGAYLQNSRPPFDENDNNRKLTIADFL